MESMAGVGNRVRRFLWDNGVWFEIAFRTIAGSILAYSLAVADIPEVIPPSQASFIGWMGAFLLSMLPSLMFAGLMAACAQFFVIVFALASVTALLVVAAKGGDGALTGAFAGFVLWIAALRYNPKNGFLAPIITVNTVLTLFAFYEQVQEPGGIELIKSLWTESGTQNPTAYMQQVLIAWGWVILVVMFPRFIPPWRTARESIATVVLPGILLDNAQYIRLGLKADSLEDSDLPPPQAVGGGIEIDDSEEEPPIPPEEDPYVKIRFKMLRNVVLLTDGRLASLTAFEPLPRIFRPVSTWVILKEVMLTLRRLTLQSLASVKFFKGSRDEDKEVAETLEYCAEVLKGSLIGPFSKEVEMREFAGWENESDPYLLKAKAELVRNAVEKWAHSMGACCSPLPEDVNMGAFTTLKLNISPWVVAWMGFYKNLFFDIPRYLLTPSSYRRLFDWRSNTDWIKAIWILKFAIGATSLFIMRVYWEAYATFSVPTNDPPGTHFSGWETIGFVMAFTQTTEGTVKKGLLRLLGTCTGGFSGWLALTACTSTDDSGSDDINPYGLVAWLATTQFLSLLIPFERGPRARLGMLPDYGYGVQNFILTQGVICLYAFNGAGTKNDLVVNRVVANSCGIAMAILLALIPPQNLAGNPRNARVILDLQEAKVLNILGLVMALGDDPGISHDEPLAEAARVNKKLEKEIHFLFDESNDFVKDGSRLPRCPVFKLDPNLRKMLGGILVTDSVIDCDIWDAACFIANSEEKRALFRPGTELRARLEYLQNAIETGDYEGDGRSSEPAPGPQMLPPFLEYFLAKTGDHRRMISQIRYGFYWC